MRHVSTVPANDGQVVGIYLHEKLLAKVAEEIQNGAKPPVVLFIEGGTVSSVPDYDLPFKDYSWMAFLARAGFDTFSMDVTGYGFSPRPEMDDPCNADPSQQPTVLVPNPLAAPCSPSYPFNLTTSQSDWDEMDSVVDYILNLRGVERLSIIGWSGGGPRGGGYASLIQRRSTSSSSSLRGIRRPGLAGRRPKSLRRASQWGSKRASRLSKFGGNLMSTAQVRLIPTSAL